MPVLHQPGRAVQETNRSDQPNMKAEQIALDVAHASIGQLPASWVVNGKLTPDDLLVLRCSIVDACRNAVIHLCNECDQANGMLIRTQCELLEQKRLTEEANRKISNQVIGSSSSVPGSDARIEKLLDAAFGQLAHDCDPEDKGSISQRRSLKGKFQKILRVR